MLGIHLEIQDFFDEDETNYETDKINKEIWTSSEPLMLIKNRKNKTKYDKQTLCKFCRKKNE